MIKQRRFEANIRERAMTARELARVVKRIAHLFGSIEAGNLRTSEALAQLSDFLDKQGSLSVTALSGQTVERHNNLQLISVEDAKALTLERVQSILDEESSTKAELIRVGLGRFGMPQARLNRLSTAEVREEVRAALGHERSLEYIDKNAERSGRTRSS